MEFTIEELKELRFHPLQDVRWFAQQELILMERERVPSNSWVFRDGDEFTRINVFTGEINEQVGTQ